MNVHQMSVTYLSEQDRILLRISTTEGEEMRLWLTRRLMLGLWPVLKQAVAAGAVLQGQAATPLTDAATRQMLTEFQREASLQSSDFSKPYAAQDAALPLGPEPLLVGEVQLTPLRSPQGQQLRIHFREKPGAGASQRGFQLELAPQLSHGLVHLLEQALQHAQWALGAAKAATDAPAAEADFAAGQERPKYLN